MLVRQKNWIGRATKRFRLSYNIYLSIATISLLFAGCEKNQFINSPDIKSETVSKSITGNIVFSSSRDGNREIYMMNPDGTNLVNLTNNPADDIEPYISGNGSQIAFASNRSGNYEIYVMNSDGTQLTNLTNSSANEFNPAWSPGDDQIAFSSDRDGNNEIYIMNSDGTGLTNLTNNPAADDYPDW